MKFRFFATSRVLFLIGVTTCLSHWNFGEKFFLQARYRSGLHFELRGSHCTN